jgi:hypothetical protein
MAVAVFSSVVARAENEQQKQERTRLKQEVKEEVKQQIKEMGMPLFTGDIWQQAPQDDKVAFVWGICHVVTLEKALMEKLPSLKVKNFSAKAAEGLTGLKINDIVNAVDECYASDPAKIDVPVVKVIWDELIKPKLKTGIAGYPLQ